ncbi:hypothetical protein ES703_35412 [subsurface metagenome]
MTNGKRPPLDEEKALFIATIAAEGVTTSAGEATGLSIIDSALAGRGADSFVGMLVVINPGESSVDSKDATAFNNATGEVIVGTAFKGGQVAAGVPYKIITFRFVPAEIATLTALVNALIADAGDASASTLGSLYAILGNPAQTYLAMLGYEGATALADKLTAARAGYLDELAAANIPADTDPKVAGRLQIKATTIDLNQAAATYDLFTATTQDVVIEKLVIRMPAEAAGGALTSISIQTDDATPQVIIDSTTGAVANLTSEAQLAWTGAILLDAGTGAKVRLTIAGGAHGSSYVCDVIAECRVVVSGGYLA